MHLFGFSVVKNESDIIESFVRFNISILDELWVVDNGSTDTTMDILRRLSREYPGLKLQSDRYLDHRQGQKLTELIKEASNTRHFDFAILLDADEFILCNGRQTLETTLSALPPQICGAIPWITYVPRADDDWSEPDVLLRIRHCRARESKPYYKVAIPTAVARLEGFSVAHGSHSVSQNNREIQMRQLEGVSFAHFPVRSPEQLASKVLIGEWSASMFPWRDASQGFHWRELSKKILTSGIMSLSELETAAAGYAGGGEAPLIEAPIPVSEQHRIRYPELINVDIVKRLAAFGNRYFGWLSHTLYSNEYISIGRTRSGPLAYLQSDTMIGHSLKMYGEWSYHELAFLLPLLRSGDTVLDVGANIGTHAIPFAQAVGPNGRVYAFEPQRPVYQVLCANAALNGLVNIYAMHVGISDRNGVVRIENPDLVNGGNIGNYRLTNIESGEPVSLMQIDNLALSTVRLIKVDTEGMEREVLLGAQQLIARDRPLLFLENNLPDRSETLLRQIESLYYRSYWHFSGYYNPANFYANTSNFLVGVGRPEINIFCVPSENEFVPKNLIPVQNVDERWQDALARSPTSFSWS